MTYRTLFPFACNDEHTSHPPFSLTRHLALTDLRAELWVMRRGPAARADFVRTPIPGIAHSCLFRLNKALHPGGDWPRSILESSYVRAFREGDAAHVYRGCSTALMRALRQRGCVVFLERINTMDHTAKRLIEDAYARRGWPLEHTYTDGVLAAQQAQAEAADFIFSPSPAVTESLLDCDVPARRILSCSYGWDPARYRATTRALPQIDGVTVLFVGGIGVRKGAHLLLDAWSRARIRGRLVLLGRMEPTVEKHCAHHLARDDVIHLSYTRDTGSVYRAADVFAFPTLEEGSPLVSYEAMGHGLPALISPIGAGSVIRDGKEGLVVDPHDEDAWVEALRKLAGDADLRRDMGDAARARAADYTWDKVAARRYRLIKEALGSRKNA
ncbi:MAG TPA: glycosyltransferase family 4 protein [Burkholderiales bacterium]|nr:glycosyltransferase family 4 protein [Burkholderiales bacterium]